MKNENQLNSNNPINKDSRLTVTKELDNLSEYTSISNLHVLPNGKMKIYFILSSLFIFAVLLSAIIYSLLSKAYVLNVSYQTTKELESVFTMNVYMFFIFLFIILLIEISKLFYVLFASGVKKLMKFIFLEMNHWFIVIKCLFGFNILISFVHYNAFNYVFITSTVINGFIIRKIKLFLLLIFILKKILTKEI